MKKGAQGKACAALQLYLVELGFLAGHFHSGEFDSSTRDAVLGYQSFHELDPTGKFDAPTREHAGRSRCGLPDVDGAVSFRTLCSWPTNRVTYAFDNGTGDTTGDSEFQAVRRAFSTWNSVLPLTFVEVGLGQSPDVVVDWRVANDPDSDMRGGVLAHADFPPGCSVVVNSLPLPIHFDDSEHTWSNGARAGAFDIETVALHEIGHILGLAHSSVAGAVMQSSIGSNSIKRVLAADDIDGARSLYPYGHWYVSWGGVSAWEEINSSSARVPDLRSGDFNGDGKSDVLASWGGRWRVSWGGTSRWEEINTSGARVRNLVLGDFDGDGKTDLLGSWT